MPALQPTKADLSRLSSLLPRAEALVAASDAPPDLIRGVAELVDALTPGQRYEVIVEVVDANGQRYDGLPLEPSTPGEILVHVHPHGQGHWGQEAPPRPPAPDVPPEADEPALIEPCGPPGPWDRPATRPEPVQVASEPAPADPWASSVPINRPGR